MKKTILLILFFFSIGTFAQQQTMTSSISPNPFEESTSITITINGNTVDEAAWGITDHSLYLWAWSYDISDANSRDCPTNGSWTGSNEVNKFTYTAGAKWNRKYRLSC